LAAGKEENRRLVRNDGMNAREGNGEPSNLKNQTQKKKAPTLEEVKGFAGVERKRTWEKKRERAPTQRTGPQEAVSPGNKEHLNNGGG